MKAETILQTISAVLFQLSVEELLRERDV